ncbi:MAG: hypothetical protein IIX59_08640 [Alistipes sp.]|jgi:hypothetical protein|nr:hypothetical protein [Alistipes sp.]
MMDFFSTLWEIIKRNPLTTLFIIMLAVAAPGVLGVFALILIIPLIIAIIGWFMVMYRVRKVQKSMDDQLRDHQRRTQSGGYSHSAGGAGTEGKVTVHVPKHEPRVSDDVGEYVPFKEE